MSLRTTAPTILQIIPRLDTGGAELSTLEITDAVVRAGGRALIASEGGRLASEISALGGELLTLPVASKNPLRLLLNALSLEEIIAAERVSLVHARSRAPTWSALIAARRARIPFVTTYHGAYSEAGPVKRLYNSVMARADLVIANSHYTAGLIRSRYGTETSRIRVIHRGVDLMKFDPKRVRPESVAELRREWHIPDGDHIVLHAARLTAWKGQRVLLDAAARLARAGKLANAIIVFAGDDQGRSGYRDELLSRAESLGIADRVRLPGHVDDIATAFAASHVAVVASTQPEAFGRAATEAQAMGVPVIATEIGAPPETVLGASKVGLTQATGWLTPPGDIAGLGLCLEAALDLTIAQRASLGARARAHIADRFTLPVMKAATLRVYDELLETGLAAAFVGDAAATVVP